MEESGKNVISFKLKFPANRDFIVSSIEDIEQRPCLYIGQCVEILCFAKNDDLNATEATLQKWSKHVSSLQAFCTASAFLGEDVDIRNTENVEENVTQSRINHERSCRPFTAGMSDEIKVTVVISQSLLLLMSFLASYYFHSSHVKYLNGHAKPCHEHADRQTDTHTQTHTHTLQADRHMHAPVELCFLRNFVSEIPGYLGSGKQQNIGLQSNGFT